MTKCHMHLRVSAAAPGKRFFCGHRINCPFCNQTGKRLFKPVPKEVLQAVTMRLQELRSEFPSHSDRELAIFMVCEIVMSIARGEFNR